MVESVNGSVPGFAREDLASVRASGVEILLVEHFHEIAHFKDIPLDVDWAAYEGAERSGRLRIFTARAGEALAGYAAYFVSHSPHYRGSLQAVQDVLYLKPEYRRARVGIGLIAYADVMLAAEGVQVTYQHSKIAFPIDPVLVRLGYERVDSIWARRLDREET